MRNIAVLGLGYVGLPLAVEFSKKHHVIGFDLSEGRVAELKLHIDRTREVTSQELAAADNLSFSSNIDDLRICDIFLVAVPTPIDKANRPDTALLRRACETVGAVLRPGGIVVFESTVYPGCTRNECVPIIERRSGLLFNKDFSVGYSPERVNPGDKTHRLTSITKVTSGSNLEAAATINRLYSDIVVAGTHLAPSIEVAEAAKVIENTQRDLNIALMNELAIIFHKLDLDTHEVLAAASTKWNFLPFTPGLVGGHCIGVDPYYLTHRAQELGYHPEVILAGRRINDNMSQHLVDRVARLMMKRGLPVVGSRVLIMGVSFKENCPDLRNSKVIDVINGLRQYQAQIEVWDPWVDRAEAELECGLKLEAGEPAAGRYDAVIVAVGHREFVSLGAERVRQYGRPNAVIFDVKGLFPREASDGRL